MRYSFSGHESFFCRPLWLKKAFDAMCESVDFTSPNAVAYLGVGKNMVSSIRFWSRAIGLSVNDKPSPFAKSIFDSDFLMFPVLPGSVVETFRAPVFGPGLTAQSLPALMQLLYCPLPVAYVLPDEIFPPV